MPTLVSNLDVRAQVFQENRTAVEAMLREIEEQLALARAGGGEQAVERLRSRGKMPIRERIELLLDRDTPFLELSPLGGWGTDHAIGGGMVTGLGVVSGVECILAGHDPSVSGGALTAVSTKKLSRAMAIARQNRLPFIQLVESAGADLRRGNRGGGEGQQREALSHFAESGRLFYDITTLSAAGIPTIAIVFGSSTAGGAYQPGMSDYNIFIRGKSFVYLGGPPLVKMATGEDSDDESLGGAEMHARTSGLADYLAETEVEAIRIARDVMSHLNWVKLGPGPSLPPDAPIYDPEELLGIVGPDLQKPFDMREVVARIVDGSRFDEFKPLYGSTLITGWASIYGFPVGILGNNGVLLSEAAEKAAQFIQLSNQINVPLVFLHNVTGYVVGSSFEAGGIVKNGSKMINAVSNSTVPHIAVLVGASYGAGTYGMSGKGYDTRFAFTWPTAKSSVMGPKQLAGVMSIVRRRAAARAGVEFDEAEDASTVAAVEARTEEASLAKHITGNVADDALIDPRDTREVLGMALSATHSNEVRGVTGAWGIFRM